MKFENWSVEMVVPLVLLVVSIAPEVLLIVTLAVAPAGSRRTITVDVFERLTSTSVFTNLAKPAVGSTVTRYRPGGRFGMRKRPSPSAVDDCVLIKLGLLTVTMATGTTAPLESAIRPSIVPVVVVCGEAFATRDNRQELKKTAISDCAGCRISQLSDQREERGTHPSRSSHSWFA